MGCDIHVFVERKVGNHWVRVSEAKGPRHPYYDEAQDEKTKAYFDKPTWSPGRNYWLFGVLAGVRANQFEPIIEPRGVPEDLSKSVAKEFKKWEGDAHTEHYYTLPELLAARDTVVDIPCYLNVSEFKLWKKTGKIPDFYHHAAPRGATLVTNEYMTRVMNMAAFLDENEYWTQMENKMSYKEISEAFFVHIIDAMQKLSKDPNKVRCVFWFDN